MNYIFVAVVVALSYMQKLPAVPLIVTLLYVFYLVAEYYIYFPLYHKDISKYYCSCLMSFAYGILILGMNEINLIETGSVFILILLGCSFVFAVSTQIYNSKVLSVLSSSKDQKKVSQYHLNCVLFQQLIYYYDQTEKGDHKSYLDLMAILNIHQSQCRDVRCVCQQTNVGQACNPGEDEEMTRKLKKGMWWGCLYTSDRTEFHRQLLRFIDYLFLNMISTMQAMKKTDSWDFQDIIMQYWFFLSLTTHNKIKALFYVKRFTNQCRSKKLFMKLTEMYLTKQIENAIKYDDHTLKYSYKQKDIATYKQYQKYEQFVLAEKVKNDIKDDVLEIVKEKI